MDKKNYFQKTLLNSKIKELNDKLKYKQSIFDDLYNKNNNSVNLSIDLDTLNNNILNLETLKQTHKKSINDLKLNISEIKNKLKEYPDIIIENINKENNILNDEIERINNDRIEITNNHIEEIKKAYIDKEQLLKNINLHKEKINYHNDYINNIQIELHKSRKNIIEQLKVKKINKNNVNNELKNNNETINSFKNKINQLKQNNNELKKFKEIVINCEYNLEYNTIILDEYYNKFNINKELAINETIDLIDNFTNSNINDINYINKKINKTESINNNILNESKNKNTNTNNFKVITYKDTYKLAKEKKKELQFEIDKLLEKYNNYEILIINIINNKFQDEIKDLDLDMKRANDRFEIIKIRLKNEEEKNKIIVHEKINNINNEILYNESNIIKVSNEIKELIKNRDSYQSINLEMKKLNIEIENYKNSIKNYEKELNSFK
jgi:hypothetical protein